MPVKPGTLSMKLEVKPDPIKLFDVDIKIAKNKVIRLVMTDQDDPFKVTKKF